MKLYLNVPYAEKDEAKALGARWNPRVKKWYVDTQPENYSKFSRWILRDTDEAMIALNYIYVIEAEQSCWKCGMVTPVIGLGIGEHINIYEEENKDKVFHDEPYEGKSTFEEEIHLAWASHEEDIPPRLLIYLKQNYFVRTQYSRTIRASCFANYCKFCGALQGNWFLFDEPDSVLSSCVPDEETLVERMRNLKIKGIHIEDGLQLNWEVGYCARDNAYLKYGNYEEIILSERPEGRGVSYEELFMHQ